MTTPITVNLLQNKAYPTLKRKSIEIGNSLGFDLSVKYGKTVTNKSTKIVSGLGPCVGLAIFAPKHKFISHSAPEIDKNSDSIVNFVSEKINELRLKDNCKDEDVSAFIYGGIAYDENNPLSDDSCRLVDAIEEGCCIEGVEPTIITGQFSNGLDTRIDSYVGDRQVTLWGKWIDKIKATQNATQNEIQKILEEFFEYVKLSQNSQVKILKELPYKTEHLLNQQV